MLLNFKGIYDHIMTVNNNECKKIIFDFITSWVFVLNNEICLCQKMYEPWPVYRDVLLCYVSVNEEGNVLFNDAINPFYLWLYGKGPFR